MPKGVDARATSSSSLNARHTDDLCGRRYSEDDDSIPARIPKAQFDASASHPLGFCRFLVLAFCILTTSACVGPGQLRKTADQAADPLQFAKHEVRSYHKLQYLSCDSTKGVKTKYYPPPDDDIDCQTSSVFNLSQDHLAAAAHAWEYALLSSNVYRETDTPIYFVPGWEFTERQESPSGLALEQWRRREAGALKEIAIVFQGTNFNSWADWRTNLSPVEPRQYKEALGYVSGVRRNNSGIKIVATGHSLGGALALNMSLRIPGIHFVGFNPSPRAFYGKELEADSEVTRLWLYESGEILRFVRIPWYLKIRQFNRLRYNFLDFIFGRSVVSVEEHSMYLFSRGLLLAAVKYGFKNKDPRAAIAFTQNLKPVFEAMNERKADSYDARACRAIYEFAENSTHPPISPIQAAQ
jgi:pimeloyl-ACP methyl ester carboxylesterase